MRSKLLNIDGIEIELTRKAIKRINLRITEDSPKGIESTNKNKTIRPKVTISAPLGTPEQDIIAFVKLHMDWIKRNIAKVEERASRRGAKKPRSGAELRHAREELRARIMHRLPELERMTGLRSNGWNIRDMHTRWGSCNTTTHHLNFSLMLASRTDEELDYVIVHELVHTVVPGHGKDFYAMMDKLMPDWRRIRKQLRG